MNKERSEMIKARAKKYLRRPTMTDPEILEMVIEEVKSHLRSMLTASAYGQLPDDDFDRRVRAILSISLGNIRMVVVNEDAELPFRPLGNDLYYQGYRRGIERMVQANFRKVVQGERS